MDSANGALMLYGVFSLTFRLSYVYCEKVRAATVSSTEM